MVVASMPLGYSPSLARPLPARTGATTPKHAAKHAGARKPNKRCLAALPPDMMLGGAGDAVDAAFAAFNHIGGHAHMHFPAMALERVTAPCSSMNCGDIVYRSTLEPTQKGINPQGVALIGLAAAYLTACPGVLQGAIDIYVIAPLQREVQNRIYGKEDFKIGKKLAQGGFGSVFLAKLRDAETGTEEDVIVKKASEYGEAEAWMNERLSRATPGCVAEYITAFKESSVSDDGEASGSGLLSGLLKKEKKKKKKKVSDDLWLVWRYEGSDTLYSSMMRKDFPYNLEETLLGRELNIDKGPARSLVMYKLIAEQLLEALAKIHANGIVHRDIKPQNIIVSESDCRLKYIDFGAAADLRVGINYVPNEFLLDPRFAPPQQYIMSTQTPTPPPTTIAAILSPVLWALNRPDYFDMYSVGIMLLQICMPPLRSDNAIMAFNTKLEKYNYDLAAWRKGEEPNLNAQMREAIQALDMDGGQLWDLLTQLVVFQPNKRLSAEAALAHPALAGSDTVRATISNAASKLSKAAEDLVNVDDAWLTHQLLGTEYSGLTEAELSNMRSELPRSKKSSRPNMRASNTIAWWDKRQSDLDKRLAERREKLRKQVFATIRLKASNTIAGRGQ